MITIVLPERSDDEASFWLRAITARLIELGHGSETWGLGGESSYGVEFKNDTFEFHPFWWGKDCPIASDSDYGYPAPGCECGQCRPNFRCGGVEIRWYKHIGRSMEYVAGSEEDVRRALRKAAESIGLPADAETDR